MSWTAKGSAGTVIDGGSGASSDLSVTSTSTILVQSTSPAGLSTYRQRMFLSTAGLRSAPGVMVTVPCDVCTDTETLPWTEGVETGQPIQYIHSKLLWHSFAGVLGGKIDLDGTKEAQIFETCVLSTRSDEPWTYDTLTAGGDGAISVSSTSGALNVLYKDPQVLVLPDGVGWLMILSRYRTLEDSSTGPVSTVAGASGDIVAWWSSTPEFAACTSVGPFLLVDSLSAWPDATVRLWLGTAGAALVDGTLLVYYTVEKNAADGGFPPLDGGLSPAEYVAALNAVGFSPGVAVSTLSWATLYAAILEELTAPGTWTDESLWNRSDSATSGAIESTALGLIQVWLSQRTGAVTAFETVYDGGGDADSVPKWADPVPAVCDGDLSLYLAGVVAGPGASVYPFSFRGPGGLHLTGSDHGLWRCRAVADGFSLWADGAVRTATFGVDFVVAPLGAMGFFGVSPDQIVQAPDSTTIYLDPDPVQMPDGSWRVYAGTTPGPTQVFSGEPADGCGKAADLGLLEADELLSDAAVVDSWAAATGVEARLSLVPIPLPAMMPAPRS